MKPDRRQFLSTSGAMVLSTSLPGPALSQSYPARPVRVIVPFAPGGPNDLLARIIAQGLSDRLGKPFYTENVGGAGGNIGTAQAAHAAPDGHTLLVVAPSYATNPSLFSSVPYDPQHSFAPVTLAATAPTLLTVHPSLAARTVAELVSAIRSRPEGHSYASPGVGTPPHLLGELFRLSLRLDLPHVPFTSGGLAIASTVAGHTPISFGALPPAVPHVRGGRLRALAVTSVAAAPALPDVPTMAEAGHPEIAADIWTAVLVPAGTPSGIVALLQREIAQVLTLPQASERMASLGYRPVGSTPEECASHIAAEAAKWGQVIRDAGITLQ